MGLRADIDSGLIQALMWIECRGCVNWNGVSSSILERFYNTAFRLLLFFHGRLDYRPYPG